MKNTKRFISLFLSIMMLIGVTTALDFSASAKTTTGHVGKSVVYSLDLSTGKLTISGIGKMYDYTSCKRSPFYIYSKAIKDVTINTGVANVGDYVFYACTSLEKVSLPASLQSIGNHSFAYCSNLASVEIPDKTTTIGPSAFEKCVRLSNITMFKSVDTISNNAFKYCMTLKVVKYNSSKENWKKINVGTGNEALRTATIFYHNIHTFEETERVLPTCEENGYIVNTCTVCGEQETVYPESLKSYGHRYVFQQKNEDGYLDYTCKYCGDEHKENPAMVRFYWSEDFINRPVARSKVNKTCFLDVVPDGIINAKDYTLILQLIRQ